jgi:membrane protein implicated in regulation of membrane protease activity
MKRILAVIQIILIILIVGFGTWQLYLGNFELAFASFPILIIYYVFAISRQHRS